MAKQTQDRAGNFVMHSMMVTPEIASRWLSECRFAGQRPTKASHVAFLAECMRRGEFETGQLVFRSWNGRRFLIDGQHRLLAVVATGIPQAMTTVECIVPSFEDVQTAYARLDRGSVRSMQDVLGAFGLDEALDLTRTQIGWFAAAIVIVGNGFARRGGGKGGVVAYLRRSAETRERLMRQFDGPARSYLAAIAASPHSISKRLSTAPVMGVGLVTFKHAAHRADIFWRLVARNDGLRAGEPAHALVNFLIDKPVIGLGEAYYSRAVAAAWNAFWDERELRLIRPADETKPIKIAGTPYDGDDNITLVKDMPGIDRDVAALVKSHANGHIAMTPVAEQAAQQPESVA